MNANGAFLYRFYGSIIFGVILITLAVMLKREVKKDQPRINLTPPSPDGDDGQIERSAEPESSGTQLHLEIPLPFFLAIRLPWKLQRSSLLRVMLILSAGLLFWEAASVDFATLFPAHMRVDVYYDLRGIKNTLADYSPVELREAGIPQNWQSRLPEYDGVLRTHLADAWKRINPQYAADTMFVKRENLHASGQTSFALERLGLLEYQLRESGGSLDQTVDAPGTTLTNFRTAFTLRPSEDDYMKSTLPQLLRRRAIVLRPQFKQTIAIDARGAAMPIDHLVIAMTKVHLWYYPRFERTVYLWIAPDGASIPIGYAVYRKF
jgi:hypothetical protein